MLIYFEFQSVNLRQLQHPHLAEFCDIDMEMVEVSLGTYTK